MAFGDAASERASSGETFDTSTNAARSPTRAKKIPGEVREAFLHPIDKIVLGRIEDVPEAIHGVETTVGVLRHELC